MCWIAVRYIAASTCSNVGADLRTLGHDQPVLVSLMDAWPYGEVTPGTRRLLDTPLGKPAFLAETRPRGRNIAADLIECRPQEQARVVDVVHVREARSAPGRRVPSADSRSTHPDGCCGKTST